MTPSEQPVPELFVFVEGTDEYGRLRLCRTPTLAIPLKLHNYYPSSVHFTKKNERIWVSLTRLKQTNQVLSDQTCLINQLFD